jgi:hypothetical protein
VTVPIAANLAESLTSAGRWDEALEVIEESLAQDLAPFGREHLLVCRGEIAAARGEVEIATGTVAQLRALPAAEAETQRMLPLTRLDIQARLGQGARLPSRALSPARADVTRGTCGRCWLMRCGPVPTRRLPARPGGQAVWLPCKTRWPRWRQAPPSRAR